MSVKITNRKYANQFFEPDQTGLRQRTDWLLGNVGEWFNLELDFEVNFDFDADMSNTVSVDNVNDKFILNNGKKWQDYGFDLGDEVTLTYIYAHDDNNDGNWVYENNSIQFIITAIYGNTIETDTNIDFSPFNTIPTNYGNKKITDVHFVVLKEPQGITFKYNLLANANVQSHNLHSFIDGEVSEFKINQLENLAYNQYVDMMPVGNQSGMTIKNVKLMKLNDTNSDYDMTLKSYSYQTMKLLPYTTSDTPPTFNGYRKGKSIKMPTLSTVLNTFQTPDKKDIPYDAQFNHTHNNEYINGNIDSLFMLNSDTSILRYFDVNTKFKIFEKGGNNVSNNVNDKLRLCVWQYSDGNALNFKRKIVISEWNATSNILNQVIDFNTTFGIDVEQGDSLAFGFEYEIDDYWADHSNRDNWYIKVETQNSELKALANGGKHKYKLLTEFMLHPFFDDFNNFENMTLPVLLQNSVAITDVFKIDVFPEWNNPNTSIHNDMTQNERLGNTGWFNENFNGFQNPFVIDYLKYYDELGNPITQIDYSKPTIVKCKISGFQNLTQNSKFGFGFAYVPIDDNAYKNKLSPYHQNLIISTGKEYPANAIDTAFDLNENVGNTVFEGNGINNVKMNMSGVNDFIVKALGQNEVEFTVKLMPTNEMKDYFDNLTGDERKYIIWASVSDEYQLINNSNRVSLLLDYNTMTKTVQPVGAYPKMIVSFLEHPEDENANGVDLYNGFVEDDLLTRIKFDIDKSTQKLQSINYGYFVKNELTGLIYKLENFNYNLTSFPIDSNNVQQINVDENRNFKLPSGNNKNWIKLNVADVQNNNVSMLGYFATKIRWEDWIERSNVPSEFYDANELHNGFNNDWLHYLRASANHKIYFFVELGIVENNDTNIYRNEYEIQFNGYDENADIEVSYNFYRHSDNSVLNLGVDPATGHQIGGLLLNEKTRIEVTMRNLVDDFDYSKIYGIIGIETENGNGEMEINEISTAWNVEVDNILLNLPSETRLKLEQISTNELKLICLIDNNKLQNVSKYKISSRIGCKSEGNDGKYEDKYEDKYE